MDLKEKFKGLFKKEVKKDKAFFTSRFDARAFFENTINIWSPEDLINKIGGLRGFENLAKDPEIYSCIDKRLAAIVDTKLTLECEDEKLKKWFEAQLLPFENQLKKDFWWSRFNGYGVEQIIYDESGDGTIRGFQREDFWRFTPLEDLCHAKYSGFNSEFFDKVLPYGKFVVTVNDGSPSKTTGNPIAEKLIGPWYMMCTSEDLWIDFAKRFANGYMHGKISDEEKAEKFRRDLEASGKSSFMVTDLETEINLVQPTRDSSLYLQMTDLASRRIQKVMLGGTQTSEMEVRGSSASASVHDEVRLEKTREDISFIENSINETILQIALVNGFILDEKEKNKLPVAKIIYDPQFNLEIANRDATLSSMGVEFKKDYFVKNYGFSEDDFEVVKKESAPSFFSANNKRTFLTKENVNSFLLKDKNNCCSHNLDGVTRKENRVTDEVDEIVELVDRNSHSPIDIELVLSAINLAENPQDLQEKLLAIFDNKDNTFVDTMTEALYLASARGAMIGNPEVLKDE